MRSTVLVTIVVALLFTTAGCGAFEPDDEGRDREPFDVDDPFDTRTIPGLTDDEVTDEVALRNAHFEGLENASSELAIRTTVRNESGTIVSDRERIQTVTDDAVEQVVETDPDRSSSDDAIVSVHAWQDADDEYTRQEAANGTVTYVPEAAFDVASLDPGAPRWLLHLYEIVDTVEQDGDGYRLKGDGNPAHYRNASVEFRLAEDGVVESFDVEATRAQRGEQYAIEHVGAVERDSDLDVVDPDWLEDARSAVEDR